MIVKLIRCKFADDLKAKFSRAQCTWSELSRVQGFVGQIGGWDALDDNLAIIVAWWQDQRCYDKFMRVNHGPIFERSGQADSYESCEVNRWEVKFEISGEVERVHHAISAGGLIRLALCEVHQDCVTHFVEVQKTVWNPAMASAGGMLAGFFSRSDQDENQYLVCTIWRTIASHENYRNKNLSTLKERAEVAKDVAHLKGYVVHVEPSWRVAGEV